MFLGQRQESMNSTGPASNHGLRVSVLVVGCGALILVSLLIPHFDPPFGGVEYWKWISGVTILLGVVSWLRRERGPLAVVAVAVTCGAVGLLLLTVIVPFIYGIGMRLFMAD